MNEQIVFAGFGGQGIMLMGKLLSQAAMAEGRHTTWMPSYGAEVRGGTAHSMVVVSSDPIPSPVVSKPSTAIVMNEPSLLKFEKNLRPGGLFVINTSLTKKEPQRKDINIIKLPLTALANELGDTRVANMVALGAYLARKQTVALNTAINCLKDVIPPHRHKLLGINEEALRKGAELAREPRVSRV